MIVLILYLSQCRDSLVFRSSWLHRLCISLLAPCDAKILLLTTAALHFCPPAVELFGFFYRYYSIHSGLLHSGEKNKTGPELCDKFLWPVMALSLKKDFVFHMTPNLFVAFFCSDVFLRIKRVCWCVSDFVLVWFCFFPQHATHNLAFLVHLAVLSVGGVREKRGREGKWIEMENGKDWKTRENFDGVWRHRVAEGSTEENPA